MKHNKKTFLYIAIVLAILFLSVYNLQPIHATNTEPKASIISGNISDKNAVAQCFKLLQKNLKAATTKDVDAYVDTLVKEAQEPTRKEMTTFFNEYDLSQTLLSFEVMKQEETSMLVRAEQKTINKGSNKFRNHITQANHTFVLENGTWKIKETIMTNTEFLD